MYFILYISILAWKISCTLLLLDSFHVISAYAYILELEQPRKTAKIPQIFSDFYYE